MTPMTDGATGTRGAVDEARSAGGDEPVWWGWGAAAEHAPLPDTVRDLLEQLGLPTRPTPPVSFGDVDLRPSRLPGLARAELIAVLGAGQVRDDRESRIRHCRGRSTVDLLRLRAGDASDAPDVVVAPADHDEVLALLGACVAHGIVAVPFGGGTSVVGGLTPRADAGRPVVAIDLARLNRLVAVDHVSGTAVLQAGLRGPMAETLLAEEGLSLGHIPQSWEYASIGGFAATRSSGQASSGFGRFDDMVTALRVATPIGTWTPGRGPSSAAGPDLRQLALGSEGAFGVITEVTVRVRPVPTARLYEGWRVDDLAAGIAVLRTLAQHGVTPTVCRLSDELETAAGLANARTAGTSATAGTSGAGDPRQPSEPCRDEAGEPPPEAAASGGCYLVAGYEGSGAEIARRADRVGALLRAGGATPLGEGVGREWVRGRFHAPYLRDALLDVGIFAETLETAGYWSQLPGLYEAVRNAVTAALAADGTPAMVMCHLSHVYPVGASLYFTVVCAQGPDPVGRWAKAKQAAGDAIIAHGGTITHHHAVGTDHLPWLRQEIGEVGIAVLRAVKHTLDPAGVLNPGVLVP